MANQISDILNFPIMGDTGQPPPGQAGTGDTGTQHPNHVVPNKTFADATQVVGKVPGGRSWQQIIEDSKTKRNILEIHMNKCKANPTDTEQNVNTKIKHLTYDDISELLFEKLKIPNLHIILTQTENGFYIKQHL